jgi:bla regulator protein BlaR1
MIATSSMWTCSTLALGLANHLWQSTLFAAVVLLLTWTLRTNYARTRYWLWLTASIKFLVPFSLLVMLGGQLVSLRHSPAPHHAAAESFVAMEQFSQPFTSIPKVDGRQLSTAPPTRSSIADRLAAIWNREPLLPFVLAAAWVTGFLFVTARWTRRWRRISKAVRLTEPLRSGREFDLLQSVQTRAGVRQTIELRSLPASMEPGIFGLLRPVLLWPQAITARLDDTHLEAVLAHEVFHVRRRDNLTAAIHMMVEAIFWFHPLVWWLETRLVEEREHACDEEVLQVCGERGIYAESILKVCEFCAESPLACVSGVTGADLKRRILQIMTQRTVPKLTLAKKLLLAATGLVVVAVPILLGQAKAAQRMMLAAVDGAPLPFRTASPVVITLAETPSSGLIAAVQAPSGPGVTLPGTADAASATSFDVASIKPNDPSNHPGATSWIQTSPDELKIMGSLKAFLRLAYGIEDIQIAGGPKWLDSDLFEIDAKASSTISPAQMKLMLRNLLIQRFKLSAHTETRPLPIYSLLVAKGGSKLQPADGGGDHGHSSGPTLVRGTLDAEQLAHLLTPILGRTVIDNTGLKGNYKFDLTWAADDQPSGPSLFTAVQEQLGLKLEAQKGPIETLVIDSAEKPSVDGAEVTAAATPVLAAQTIPPNNSTAEAAVARVNGQAIDQQEYQHAQQQLLQEAQRDKVSQAELERRQKDLLRDLIDQRLLLARGKELNINPEPEMAREIDSIRTANHMATMEDFEKALRQSGTSLEDFKANLRNQVMVRTVVRDEVGRTLHISATQVQAYYEQHKQAFAQPEQVRLSEILIPTPAFASSGLPNMSSAKPLLISDALIASM